MADPTCSSVGTIPGIASKQPHALECQPTSTIRGREVRGTPIDVQASFRSRSLGASGIGSAITSVVKDSTCGWRATVVGALFSNRQRDAPKWVASGRATGIAGSHVIKPDGSGCEGLGLLDCSPIHFKRFLGGHLLQVTTDHFLKTL